jgi:hypothetical protein
MDIVSKLREQTVDQQISKALTAAQILARQGRDAYSLDEVTKALDTAEAGGGAEFVFTGMSAEVINQVRQDLVVSSVFPHIAMPTNPYKVPVELSPATAYLVPENTADTGQTSITASQAGTANVTFTAKSIGAMTRVSKELNQDSIIPMVPFIQSNLMRGLANGLENALINGDSTATHQDTDTEAAGATHVAAGWKGLRKHAIENSYSVDISTWNLSKLRDMRKLMGKFGINPQELVLIVSNSAYIQTLSWAELVTLDKYGPAATVMTGEIGRVDGIRVVVSPFMREDLDATGVNGASGNTKTGVLLVNRQGFAIGDRQTIELDQTDEPKAFRQISILADMRVDFQAVQPIASNKSVVFGYNLAS